jgi:hypothetical protein
MWNRRFPLLLVALLLLPALAGAQDLPWRLTRIPAPDPAYGLFGHSLALSGDTLAVGAIEKTRLSLVVYVYEREGEEWALQATFRLANSGETVFPPILALSGDTLAVGRPSEKPGVGGSVFIYSRRDGTWTRETRLRTTVLGDLGFSLALSGDTLAVGDIGTLHGEGRVGSVTVFRRRGRGWDREAQLSPRELTPDAQFGYAVALEGDRLVVGAQFDDLAPVHVFRGSVRIYHRRGTQWQLEKKFVGGPGRDQLGEHVSLSGDHLAVGAYGHDRAATIYEHGPEGWRLQTRLARVDQDADGIFGFVTAIEGRRAVTLGTRKTAAGRLTVGAYLFEESGGVWTLHGLLDDRHVPYSDAVAIEGDTIALGADRAAPSGEVHVYTPE